MNILESKEDLKKSINASENDHYLVEPDNDEKIYLEPKEMSMPQADKFDFNSV